MTGESENKAMLGRGESRIADSPAQKRSAERLLHARGSIWEAFDSLDIGWDHDDVLDYLNSSESFRSLNPGRRWRVAGMIMAFGIVAVERERDA